MMALGLAAKRLGSRVGLAALLVLALLLLSQCRMVNDRMVGVDVGLLRTTPAKCADQCQKNADKAVRLEARVHLTYVGACNGDPTCLADEDARHQAALQNIESQRQQCIADCHNQGGSGE